jgi:hypothetical protein
LRKELLVSALILLGSLALVGACIGAVIINEVELNPPGDERKSAYPEWVELYNDGDQADIGGWNVSTSHGESVILPEGTIIPTYGTYIVTSDFAWLADENETITLRDANGAIVDQTPVLTDRDDNEYAWSRMAGTKSNSSSNWNFQASSYNF